MIYLKDTMLHLLGSSDPSLNDLAKCYFLRPSKQLRPLLASVSLLMVMLTSPVVMNLGDSFSRRFDHLGQLDDVEKAISADEDAIRHTPDGHAKKQAKRQECMSRPLSVSKCYPPC